MTVAPLARDERVTARDAELVQRVHRRIVGEGGDDATLTPDALRNRLVDLLRREEPLLAPARLQRLLAQLTDEVVGLGPLEPLLADPAVTEVMLNGPGRAYVERDGRIEPVDAPTRAPNASFGSSNVSWRRSACASIARHRWSTHAFPTGRDCTR